MISASTIHLALIIPLFLLLVLFPVAKVLADSVQSLQDIDINGVIVDDTMTLAGHSFYREFAKIWQQSKHAQRVNLVILERPSARYGSQLFIEYRQQVLFSLVISSRQARFESLCSDAASQVSERLKDLSFQALFENNPDLSSDEF